MVAVIVLKSRYVHLSHTVYIIYVIQNSVSIYPVSVDTFILWASWVSVLNFMAVHANVFEIFQSGLKQRTNRRYHPWSLAGSVESKMSGSIFILERSEQSLLLNDDTRLPLQDTGINKRASASVTPLSRRKCADWQKHHRVFFLTYAWKITVCWNCNSSQQQGAHVTSH